MSIPKTDEQDAVGEAFGKLVRVYSVLRSVGTRRNRLVLGIRVGPVAWVAFFQFVVPEGVSEFVDSIGMRKLDGHRILFIVGIEVKVVAARDGGHLVALPYARFEFNN